MTGDQDDLFSRIWSVLAPWFGDPTTSPVIAAAVQGAAWALAFIYSLYAFAKAQTRFATMSGGWLDLGAGDFFGDRLPRFGGEPDSSYARRIRLEVLRDRNTRNAIDRAVFDLTGDHPTVFEPWRPADCGCLGVDMWLGGPSLLGTPTAPFTVYITTPAPKGFGIPNLPGLDDAAAGLDSTLTLADAADTIANGPTPADVLDALERVRTAGRTYYVTFT